MSQPTTRPLLEVLEEHVAQVKAARRLEGWCSRRREDGFAPDDHDGGFIHTRRDSCEAFVSAEDLVDEWVGR